MGVLQRFLRSTEVAELEGPSGELKIRSITPADDEQRSGMYEWVADSMLTCFKSNGELFLRVDSLVVTMDRAEVSFEHPSAGVCQLHIAFDGTEVMNATYKSPWLPYLASYDPPSALEEDIDFGRWLKDLVSSPPRAEELRLRWFDA